MILCQMTILIASLNLNCNSERICPQLPAGRVHIMDGLINFVFKISSFLFSLIRLLGKKPKKLPDSPERILLIKTHAIGDTIMITPAIRALRKRFSKAYISLLTGRLSKEIIDGNTHINDIISFDESALFAPNVLQIIKLIKRIRENNFDITFIFHYSTFMHLLALAFGIPTRIGYDNEGSGFSLTHKIPWDEKVERWTPDVHLDMVRLTGAEPKNKRLNIEISDDDMKFADDFLKSNQITPKDLLIGIFPGGGKNPRDTVYQKCWGIEKYAHVVDILSAKRKAKIIVFGSQNDINIVSKLTELCETKIINTCGKVKLKQVSALIKQCSLLITNDSAPLHIAVAVDTPTVSLFGPSSAKAILKEDMKHISIQSSWPCSPCYSNKVFPGCCNPECMEAIECDEVLKMAEKQIDRCYFTPNFASISDIEAKTCLIAAKVIQ